MSAQNHPKTFSANRVSAPGSGVILGSVGPVGGLHPCSSHRLSDAACRIERAKIFPATGPKMLTSKAAYRRGILKYRQNAWHTPRTLGESLFTDDSKGLFKDEYAAEDFAAKVLAAVPRQNPPPQETMAETVDYFLAHPSEVPEGMRLEFEAERVSVNKVECAT